ncbi:transposase family protein [Nonomuraea sp. B19D2]|uniref:transposase family protein n=1 Tax=Nonomuraea sp. B19D2 TaxID=3159561 RepID=UPI0032D9B538
MSGSRPTPEQWEAALYRLRQLSDQGRSVTAEVKRRPAARVGGRAAGGAALVVPGLRRGAHAGVRGRGERARRAKLVYLQRPATFRNQVWEGDHKSLPIVVLPPRGKAVTPWVTMFLDDATRLIIGWAIALAPHAGTVLTALRMGMLQDPATGPAHGVPGLLRLDQGLEFAAASVQAATAALGVEMSRSCRPT